MKNLARQIEPTAPQQFAAEVLGVEGGRLALRGERGAGVGRRALSCLVAPQAGDRVLVALLDGELWVLAVLEREGAAGVRIEADGDLELHAPRGRVAVNAREGVEVLTPGSAALSAGRLEVHGLDATLTLERVEVLAGMIEAEVEQMRGRFTAHDTVAERVTERVERVYRYVSELEQVRARRVDCAVQETLQLHAGDTLVTSERLVKIDGAQVHLG